MDLTTLLGIVLLLAVTAGVVYLLYRIVTRTYRTVPVRHRRY